MIWNKTSNAEGQPAIPFMIELKVSAATLCTRYLTKHNRLLWWCNLPKSTNTTSMSLKITPLDTLISDEVPGNEWVNVLEDNCIQTAATKLVVRWQSELLVWWRSELLVWWQNDLLAWGKSELLIWWHSDLLVWWKSELIVPWQRELLFLWQRYLWCQIQSQWGILIANQVRLGVIDRRRRRRSRGTGSEILVFPQLSILRHSHYTHSNHYYYLLWDMYISNAK